MKNNCKYYFPTLGQSWGLVLLLLVFGTLLAWPLTVLVQVGAVSYIVSFIPPVLWILFQGNRNRNAGRPFIRLDAPDYEKMHPVLFFVAIALVVIAIGVLCDPISSLIPMPEVFKEIFEKAFDSNKPLDLILSTAILAPLCEEFLCRGIILRGLLCRMSATKAILWSSFIFAFMHMNPWQAIPAFIIAVFLGWIYYRTHSLWACIFMHFVNNGTAAAMMLLFPDIPVDAQYSDFMSTSGYVVLLVSAAIVSIVGIMLLNNKLNKNEEALSFKVQAQFEE